MALAAGTRLGPYEIAAQIGVGGMGEVYRATDTRLKRQVAIKVLPESVAAHTERLARFQREAEVLASLNHPNIAAIYGLEDADGVKALAMELVEGPTLADRIVEGPVPVDEALRIARQIAEALEAAHEQGIVHRDLKPANIKVRDDNTVKVLDFGLAKALEPASATAATASQSPTITTPAMTQMGVILGTAAYMSPEQAKGRAADKRSDVWAFGCVLYEMLSGKRAFEGEDISDTLAAVLRGAPDWTALSHGVPSSIRLLLQRCLERDRTRRLADISIASFVMKEPAILTGLTDGTAAGSVPAPAWRGVIPYLLAAMVIGVLGIAAGRTMRPAVLPPSVSRFPLTLPEGQQLSESGLQVIAISPDGERMVYVANRRLYLRSMSELEARPIPGTEVSAEAIERGQGVIGEPVFSPDSRSIAFWEGGPLGGSLKRVSITGGTPVTIARGSAFGMSWSREGIFFSQAQKGILRVSEDGGQPTVIATIDDGLAWGPQILPGGDALLFTFAKGVREPAGAPPETWDSAQIVVQSLTSGERTIVHEGGFARYIPTGHLLYAIGGTLFAAPFDVKRRKVTGPSVSVVPGVRRPNLVNAAPGSVYCSVSDSGVLMYVPGPLLSAGSGLSVVAVLDRTTGVVEPLRIRPALYQYPRISPDGKRIAVETDDSKAAHVWIYELSGESSLRQLTVGSKNRFPVWSGDGQFVTFQSDREGDSGIWWQRADGSLSAERLTTADQGTSHIPESWSPDGRVLLFAETKGANVTLWTLSFPDRKKARFGEVESSRPTTATFSHDGRWVAYTSPDTDGTPTVFVQPFPTTGIKIPIARHAFHPLWAPDGAALFYRLLGTRSEVVTVKETPAFSFGPPQAAEIEVMRSTGNTPRQFDITPDGKRLIGIVGAGRLEAGEASQITVVLNWLEELKRLVPTN